MKASKIIYTSPARGPDEARQRYYLGVDLGGPGADKGVAWIQMANGSRVIIPPEGVTVNARQLSTDLGVEVLTPRATSRKQRLKLVRRLQNQLRRKS